ncbi:capsular polysaccharide biosynthesis protein Cap8F [Thalassobacillus devorans]|uniref:Capsular polysaccharide biosynthesis protein Cap8F n=1 Tax=Thalassobacillus devorans TaxID=279813 RepID=A0ABQ1P192_9BACI|nr:NAD-dependent epimerase/dehydratase family protein [Thalassobacillus devorans]NIK28616.1 UDP-2-acetamido-2,6-beta-L-arabino-hexul-4-ose reductase [Thalassobacillus devorans]GGC84846.1 capsular polysaccharide biosynthesis protein Cap8F [Thalassobacillus devorans]
MNILVTGANGFLGKNLVAELKQQDHEVLPFTRDNTLEELEAFVGKADFIFHLAGVNRPKKEEEFYQGNKGLTEELISLIEKNEKKNTPMVLSSSIQAEKDNPYGASKKLAEKAVIDFYEQLEADAYVYRLPNLFGKWSRPNYNSVVATFCHNIARDQDIQVNNPEAELALCYIDDVLDEFNNALQGHPTYEGKYCTVKPVHRITLQELADTIISFKKSRSNLNIPDMGDSLTKKLYSTYLSYLPTDQFSYDLKMNVDERGSFTEILKTPERGQVSVNVSKPGITKGNHWHHTKNEKFLVVSGEGLIRFRKIDTDEVIEYFVSGSKMEVVDIPVGYTHSIVNVGETDLVTVMWANEKFDPDNPDTYYLEV